MAITITRLSLQYRNEIVRLHRTGIKTGFLSTTSDVFLRTLYSAISRSPYSRVYVAIDDNSSKFVGFIAGALSTSSMYRHIILRHGLLFFILLLPKISKLSIIKKILETLFYIRKKHRFNGLEKVSKAVRGIAGITPYRSELLSIGVDENSRGQKIGRRLIEALERYFAENDIHNYKVVTYSKDTNANSFYRACGFIKYAEFIHHGNLMFEYTKTIPDPG